MPHRFCAICGKTIDKTAPHIGMCFDCFSVEHPLFELPKKFSFKICIDCSSYSIKEEWYKSDKNELFLIIEEITNKFLLKSLLKNDKIDFFLSFNEESLKYSSTDILRSLDMNIKGVLKENIKISHQQVVELNLNHELCKNCTNLRSGTYFISIIQLRVKDETQFNIIHDVLHNIQKYVEKLFENDQRNYISKIDDQKNGVDLYLSTNELMKNILKFLKSNYYFILKRSKKLVGRDNQKGRNIYRHKILIKFLPIKRNDAISIEEIEYLVENLSKSKVVLRSGQGTKLIKDFSFFFNDKFTFKKKKEEE